MRMSAPDEKEKNGHGAWVKLMRYRNLEETVLRSGRGQVGMKQDSGIQVSTLLVR